MIRSPYWHGMHRGVDTEGGGAADLQTDVMRFMAILAICLVVIFALVQSIPLTPVQTVVVEPEPIPEPEPVAEPVAEPIAEPIPEPVPEPLPEPAPVVEAPAPVVAPPPPVAEPQEEGFTLRFESDIALTRLVARNVIGLYAIGDTGSQRMNYSQGRISFWEASTPNQFHEMERTTVPGNVLQALLRTAELDPTTVKWGVTLPAAMQQDLNDYLETETGGSLVIAADGRLRLEQ